MESRGYRGEVRVEVEIVVNFQEQKKGVKPGGRRYPWAEWFKKKKFTLVKGVDFDGLEHGMMQTIRQAATRAGIRVSVYIGSGEVRVEVRGLKKK